MSKVFNMVGGGGGPAASIFVTGLSETDIVKASKGAKTLPGKWMQKPNPALHGLPDGYTELDYIESTGTQYIDTGLYYDQDYVFTIKVAPTYTSGDSFAMGAQNGQGYSLHIGGIGQGWATWRFIGKIRYDSPSDFNIDYLREYVLSKDGASSEGQVFTLNTQYSYSSGNKTILLFGTNTSTSSPQLSTYKIAYFNVTKNDITVQELVPCKRNSDGAIGMYDLVTNVFFENSGTGEFISGPEAQKTIGGFLIKPIREFGTWTVTATNGTKTTTQDVLVDVITDYEIEMSLSA